MAISNNGNGGERNGVSPLHLFKKKMQELFRLAGEGDLPLDCGVHRLVRLREQAIQENLIEGLEKKVKETLDAMLIKSTADAEGAVFEAEKEFRESFGKEPSDKNILEFAKTPKATALLEVKEVLRRQKVHAVGGDDVLRHLLEFFGRYYDGGDFIPMRKISATEPYTVPYFGNDVMLHWASKGSYYVKTAECRAAAYSFPLLKGGSVMFFLRERHEESEMTNGGRGRSSKFFIPRIKDANLCGNSLNIPVEYCELTDGEIEKMRQLLDGDNPVKSGKTQSAIVKDAIASAKKQLKSKITQASLAALTEISGDGDSLLYRHFIKYCRTNDSDYFIHRNLDKYLYREIDSYVKTEILRTDMVAEEYDEAYLARAVRLAAAVQRIGREIIRHLGELEDFQKMLWEKKKFITSTHYIVRLSEFSETVRKALSDKIAMNSQQWDEWRALGFIGDDESHGLFPAGRSKKFLDARLLFMESRCSLPVDTRHFDADFRDELVASFDNLDDVIDGICFHGDNWQVLRVLKGTYEGMIDVCYADPPYNTKSSAIIYKNNYKDSSWLSLMYDRVLLSRDLLSDSGVFCCAIDDEEHWRLRGILDDIFPRHLGVAAVRSNPAGRKSTEQLAPSHEYALFYGNDSAAPSYLLKSDKQLDRYPIVDDKGRYAWFTLIRQGSGDRREDTPTMYYPIYVKKGKDGEDASIRVPEMVWNEEQREYDVLEEPKKGEDVVYPVVNSGNGKGEVEKRWQRGWERVNSDSSDYRVMERKGKLYIEFKTRMDEKAPPNTWWGDSKYASSNHGAIAMKSLFGGKPFDFPKAVELVSDCLRVSGANNPDAIVLDCFAGSGTTAHAVINLNRADGGKRKFILVEAGGHFETVVLPRIKKLIYAPEWENGMPARLSNEQCPRVVKYHSIESYEDTLENTGFATPSGKTLELESSDRYVWEWESRGSVSFMPPETLKAPLQLQLKRSGGDGEECLFADLPETFNYMSGMHLMHRSISTHSKIRYLFDFGVVRGSPVVHVWRNIVGWNQRKHNEDDKHIQAEVDKFTSKNGKFKGAIIKVNGCKSGYRSLDDEFHSAMFSHDDEE